MKVQIWPKQKTGRYASTLTLTFAGLIWLKTLNTGIRLPLPTPVIALLGIAGFVMGIVSVIKDKDRSLLVRLSLLVGVLIIVWVGAEIAFPH